jgi:hypothetical protein
VPPPPTHAREIYFSIVQRKLLENDFEDVAEVAHTLNAFERWSGVAAAVRLALHPRRSRAAAGASLQPSSPGASGLNPRGSRERTQPTATSAAA